MATRFYFPADTAAPVTPATSGMWYFYEEASWEDRKLERSKTNTSLAQGTPRVAFEVNWDYGDRRYVSAPLAAQTISGTFKMQLMAYTTQSSDNFYPRIGLYVVTNDGSSVRGTLKAVGFYGSGTIVYLTYTNKIWASSGTSLDSLAISEGDRLVVAIGYRCVYLGNFQGRAKWGDPSATSDFGEDNTDTSDKVPWIEFSGDLLFGQTYTATPSDTIAISDSVTAVRSMSAAIGIQDTIAITDAVLREADYLRAISEDYYVSTQFNSQPSGASNSYGRSTAIDGEWMVVTDPAYGSNWHGGARVYRWTNGRWVYKQLLQASDEIIDARFGLSCDMHGDTLIIGAPYRDEGGLDKSGAAYVFVQADGVWTQQQKLTMSTPAVGQFFGTGVAISGDTAVVSANGAGYRGKLHVFDRSAGVWSETTTLEASDKADSDYMGGGDKRVSICKKTGTTIAAGACTHGHSGYYADSGAVYVWTYSGSWTEQQDISSDINIQQHQFGCTVHVDGDTLAVGAVGSGLQTGSYPSGTVYTRSGVTWSAVDRVQLVEVNARGYAAACASEDSGWLIVGYPYSDVYGANYGQVRFYKKIGATYTHLSTQYFTSSIQYLGVGMCMDPSMETAASGRVSVGHSTDIGKNNTQVYSFGSGAFEITETLQVEQRAVRAVADSLTLADSSSRSLEADRWAADELGLADDTLAQLFLSVIERAADDDIEVVDIVKRSAEFGRTPFYPNVVLRIDINN